MTETTITGPVQGVQSECDRILRSLPEWFGIEESLLEYVRDTDVHPTFLARVDGRSQGFLTARRHFAEAWEVHCIAVHASCRGLGLGRALHEHVEAWLRRQGVRFMQVKTMAEEADSPEYAETRAFYGRIGYVPLEMFPELWGPDLPVLQLVKLLVEEPQA